MCATYKSGRSLAVAQRDATRLPGTPESSQARAQPSQPHFRNSTALAKVGPTMCAGAVADWLAAVQGGRYVAEYGGAITYHFADEADLMALARLTRLGIDNVLKRVGVERAGVRLVLTAAVRKLRDSAGAVAAAAAAAAAAGAAAGGESGA